MNKKRPVISKLGKLLLDSNDSQAVTEAVRELVLTKTQTIKLSQDTIDKIKLLNDK